MTRSRKYALLALLSVASATFAVAQTESPTRDQTDPSAASSPHQRDSTSNSAAEAQTTQGAEATDAATPHQKQVTDKGKHDQMMKDCMRKQQANDSSMTKDAAKKACADQMKMQGQDTAKQ
jgi:hypothetical protein